MMMVMVMLEDFIIYLQVLELIQMKHKAQLDYSTGQITLNSLNVASISNIRGATSTVIELTVTPNSNDVVPVRDQIVEIDIANSTINVTADSFVGGSADAGVGYTTTSSY